MKNIICWIKGHKRGTTLFYKEKKTWRIKCQRCGYWIEYRSPRCRLVSEEMRYGFNGE